MNRAPYNEAAHGLMLDEGYDLIQLKEDAGDEGNGESGPRPWYAPPMDMYESSDHRIFINTNGAFAFQEDYQDGSDF